MPTDPPTRYPRRRVLRLAGVTALAGAALAVPAGTRAAAAPRDAAPGLGTAARDRHWQRQAERIRVRHQEIIRRMAVNEHRRGHGRSAPRAGRSGGGEG